MAYLELSLICIRVNGRKNRTWEALDGLITLPSGQNRMITAIVIQNFKGIGNEPFRLPIKPITLLFGPNGGGKSTVLQAFHYAREVLDRRNLDAEVPSAGGNYLDLGGFRNFVNSHDEGHSVTFKFELSANIPCCFADVVGLKDRDGYIHAGNATIGQGVQTAAVEFTVRMLNKILYVTSYSTEIDGQHFATIIFDPERSAENWHDGHRIENPNFDHPILTDAAFGLPPEKTIIDYMGEYSEGVRNAKLSALNAIDALPDLDAAVMPIATYEEGGSSEATGEGPFGPISHFLLAPGRLLRDELRQFRYIGPFREPPDREHVPPNYSDVGRWASGLAAWDEISQNKNDLVRRVNDWIADEDRLALRYCLQLRGIRLRDEKQTAVLVKQGSLVEVPPRDTGVGISQVLPVVVAAVDDHRGITAVEQPELHLHPRLQCELGDLFIHGALGQARTETSFEPDSFTGRVVQVHWPRTFIIETHSEHLILRILRRIRETTRAQSEVEFPVTPDDVSVVYVCQTDGQSVPEIIGIDGHGEFTRDWPDDFFESDFYERFS